MADETADRSPLSTAMAYYLQEPDVLADPTQRDAEGTWTLTSDVMPGRSANPGSLVVASWGARSWRARVMSRSGSVLRLQQVGRVVSEPTVASTYSRGELVDQLLASLPDRLQADSSALRAALLPALNALLDDVDTTICLLLAERSMRQRVARRLLDRINSLPSEQQGAVTEGSMRHDLHQLALRAAFTASGVARPPTQDGD